MQARRDGDPSVQQASIGQLRATGLVDLAAQAFRDRPGERSRSGRFRVNLVVRPAPGRVSVLRLRTAAGAPREGVIAALLAAAMTHTGATSLRWLNVAEDDPGSAALRELGGQLEIRQVEMARAL